MPSHTIHSALTKLFQTGGAPWDWQTWKGITGIHHGIFPADDNLLPKGLTRGNAVDIQSYFNQYDALPTEDAKIKFASQLKGSHIPGRAKWREWVTAGWKSWKIHSRIVEVLTNEALHPLTIMVDNNNLELWPSGDTYVPLVVDAVALNLFGEESLDHSGRLAGQYRQITQQLIQRSWINIHKLTVRNRSRLGALEDAATRSFNGVFKSLVSSPSVGVCAMDYWAFSSSVQQIFSSLKISFVHKLIWVSSVADLDQDRPTKTKISAVIRAVSRWKTLAELYPTDETIEKIEKMEDELKRLMGALGAKVKVEANTGPGMSKVNRHALSSLATQVDVTDVISLYHEFFSSNQEGEASSFVNEEPLSIPFGTAVEGADPGVEFESTMSPESLASNLGFINGLPLLFNPHRHRGGLSPWSHPAAFDINSGSDLEPLKLFWHQLAGIHATIRMTFHRTKSSTNCNGVLIADEVGLGKTFLAVTVVVFLSDLVMRQLVNLPLPPLIKANPYLREHETIPCYPHLIVVAGTLLSQWESELKTLIKPQSFDIFTYGSGKTFHQNFWSPSGPFHSSRHRMANRIIIASYTALQQDFNAVFFSKASLSKKLPWTLPERLPDSEKTISKTLYGQKYLTITVDEAHSFRNTGPRHSSILLLLDRAELRLILTATPLQTSTKDVSAMGRLTGVAHFFTEDAHQEEKNDTTNLRRAKKEQLQDDCDVDNLNGDGDDPVKLCQNLIAQRMQAQFQGRVIRRTIDSKDWQGRLLLNIPPYKAIHAILNLTEREKDKIVEKANEVKDGASAANGSSKFTTRSFYIEYRMTVGYAKETGKENQAIPVFKTLQAWELSKSTKMDTCAQICRHLLTRDDAPPIVFEDGQAIFPPIPPPVPGVNLPQDAKILIYQEFTSLRSLLRNVLLLYGVQSLSIDGQTSFEDRATTVNKFRTDPTARVLIFSSVGSTGLNLSCASVIIFLDQPWSAQDERQIRGRAHRQPQTKEVLVIHLLANDTADIVLSGMARGKHDMLEAFFSKQSNQDLCQLLAGKALPSGDGEESDDSTEGQPGKGKGKKPAKEKKKRRVKKSAVVIDDDPVGDAQPGEVTAPHILGENGWEPNNDDASFTQMGDPVSSGSEGLFGLTDSEFTDGGNSMYSIATDASMRSASSNASMLSTKPSASKRFNPTATRVLAKSSPPSQMGDPTSSEGERLPVLRDPTWLTKGAVSLSNNVSMHLASSNPSMKPINTSASTHPKPPATQALEKSNASVHSTHMAVDAPNLRRDPFRLVGYSSPPSPSSSYADGDEERQGMERPRDPKGQLPRLPMNVQEMPPQSTQNPQNKRTAEVSLTERFFKRHMPEPLTPTPLRPPKLAEISAKIPTAGKELKATHVLPKVPRKPKWSPNLGRSSGSSSQQSNNPLGDSDRATGSQAEVVGLPGSSSSTIPRHREPGRFLSPPPKTPKKMRNPFAKTGGK